MEWKEILPNNVRFVRMPVIFRDSRLQLAEAFYAAKDTRDLERSRSLLFNFIHPKKRHLIYRWAHQWSYL